MDIITSTKGYKNNTLEPLTKNLNKQVYSLQKYKNNVLSTFSWLEPVLIPALRIGIAKSSSNLVHCPPSHILSHALCKSKKIFSQRVTLSCDDVPSKTNLDRKSFSISEDLVEPIVALTLNIAKWYFWMILWLTIMHHHTKFDPSEILSSQTFTEVQNLHCDLDLEYSKATFSQDTPAYEHALWN